MITNRFVLWDTDYGVVTSNLKKILEQKNTSMYELCRLTGLRYEVVKKYYYNTIIRYDSEVVAKICFVLDCDIEDWISYKSSYSEKVCVK